MSTAVSDRIEKQVILRAPLSRVWQALTDADQFGQWFGVRFDGRFEATRPITGKIAPTTVDPDVAKMQKPYEGMKFDIVIDRIEPIALRVSCQGCSVATAEAMVSGGTATVIDCNLWICEYLMPARPPTIAMMIMTASMILLFISECGPATNPVATQVGNNPREFS